MKNSILITLFLAIFCGAGISQTLNKPSLCKTWYLHHYKYLWVDYNPEGNEKNDFICFKEDMTYISVDEGKKTTGKWSFNPKKKSIQMYGTNGECIKLMVEKLKTSELVIEIDHKDLKGVSIYYLTTKNQ